MEMKKIKRPKKEESVWKFLLWWKIDPEELKNQIENYDTLKIHKSARGWCLFVCLAILIFSTIIGFLSEPPVILPIGAVIYLVLGILMYKGQRWAMIISMILWTLEKGALIYMEIAKQNYQNIGFNIVQQVAFWCIFMHVFYFALRVENARRAKKA